MTVETAAEVFDAFLALLVEHSPVTATRLGDHTRDHDLDDWPAGAADARLRELAALQARVAVLDTTAEDRAADALLLADAVAGLRFELEELAAPQRDPLFYLDLATAAVYELLRRNDLPPEPRRAAVADRLAQVPRLLHQAQVNLDAVPDPHREVALLRLPGAAALFTGAAPAFAPAAEAAGRAAADACKRFAAWLEDRGRTGAHPGWQLGERRWADALRLALGVHMPPEEVHRRATARLAELADRAEELASRVLGRTDGRRGAELVAAGLQRCALDHPPRDGLVEAAEGCIADIVRHVADLGVFDLGGADSLRVEQVPEFQQGVAVAFFVPAPPLETAAEHTYYLSGVPSAWDEGRAESFLREYNLHALRSVGIHEAIPGHYLQFLHANRHPRLLRRALWNSAFAEGWAVYVEQLVVDSGYGGDRLALVSTKLAMRAVANALLDQGLHVGGMSDAEALDLLVRRTHQERSEADGKLVRGKVTAGQLSTYFVGGEEMADLRRDVAAARGPAFDERGFHSDVLAQGTLPFPALRAALLA